MTRKGEKGGKEDVKESVPGWEKAQETWLGFRFEGVEACSRIEGILRHKAGFQV